MLTHCITLPNGTEIEFFASDDAGGNWAEIKQEIESLKIPSFSEFKAKLRANKAKKKARKLKEKARRKQR